MTDYQRDREALARALYEEFSLFVLSGDKLRDLDRVVVDGVFDMHEAAGRILVKLAT